MTHNTSRSARVESMQVEKEGFSILHQLRVRWNECDMHGIVFNANYFLYYDIAMFEWQRAVGDGVGAEPDFVTAHAECDFLQSARFDDYLDIGVRCAAIGSKSINLEGAIFRGSQLLNRGKLVYAHVAKGTTQTAAIGSDLLNRIMAFEKTAPLRAWKVAGDA